MTIHQVSAQQVYHSFDGFEQMRAQARDGDSEALSGAAKQFESVFVQMMLKAMRDTVPEGGLFDSEQSDFYQGMFDQQISLNIANGKGVGLSEIIERQLSKLSTGSVTGDESTDGEQAPLRLPVRSPFAALRPSAIDVLSENVKQPDQADEAQVPPPWMPTSPQAFADELRPYAQRAAVKLGVSENVLIAQAALETGWGQKVIPRNDGGSSFNLFGIKANANWQGDKASTATLEYSGGTARRERAEFRVYASLEQSFDDYVAFLREQPRYSDALNATGDKSFAEALQDSGYATDPAYAEKILAVKERLDGNRSIFLAAGLTTGGDRR